MRHYILDFFPSVVSIFHAGVGLGDGEQQCRVQSPTLGHAVNLGIHFLQAANLQTHTHQLLNASSIGQLGQQTTRTTFCSTSRVAYANKSISVMQDCLQHSAVTLASSIPVLTGFPWGT